MSDATIITQSSGGDQAVIDQKINDANATLPDTLKFNVMKAAATNPDQFAQEKQLAQKTGVPVEAVPSNYEILKQRAAVDGYNLDTLRQTNPVTAQFLDDQIHAKLAHDDINSLQNLEKRFGVMKEDRGPSPAISSIASGLVQGLVLGAKKQYAGAQLQLADLTGAPVAGVTAQREYNKAQFGIDTTTPDFETSTAKAIYGGAASALQNAPGLAFSMATGTALPAVLAMGLQTQLDTYGKYRARGATPQQALLGSGIEGAVESGTEMIPMGFLIKKLGKVGFKEFATGFLGRELPTEQLATFLQDATDTAIANPDKTWDQFLTERPDAAYQTAVSTLTQALIMGGLHKAVGHHESRAEAATVADQVQGAMDATVASKLHQRDPQTFKDFVDSNTKGDAYISTEALNKIIAAHGKEATDVIDQMPSVDKAMAQALETGQDIAIPISELVTYGAGSTIESDLVSHIRLDPAKPSLAELSAETDSVAEASKFVREGAGKSEAFNEQLTQLNESEQSLQPIISQQLQEAGYEASTAKDTALSISRAVAVIAQRANPTDIAGESQRIWQQYNVHIHQVMQGAQGQGAETLNQAVTNFTEAQVDDGKGGEVSGVHSTFDNNNGGTGEIHLGIRDGVMTPKWVYNGMHEGEGSSKGAVTQAYEDAIHEAQNRGLTFQSDNTVTETAARVYDSLAKKGYEVWKNPNATFVKEGGQVVNPHWQAPEGEPVFKVLGDKKFLTLELMRGVPPESGALDTSNTVANALFFTQDEKVARSYAGEAGKIIRTQVNFSNMLSAKNWFEAKDMLSLPRNATMSELINAARMEGYDGLTFKTSNGQEYVSIPQTVNIPLDQKERGQLDISDRNNFAISLFSGRNLSTVLHEAGHFYLEVIADLAVREQSDQQIKDDFEAISKAFNFDAAAWQSMTLDQKREIHENFARSNEAYLLRGVAPSERLRMVFYRFKEWMKQVYQTVRRGITGEQALDVKMSPEVIEVFDRIYATDLEIANMREHLDLKPQFIDTHDSTLEMSQEDMEVYQKIAAKEIEIQESKLRHDIMESELRARKQWYKDEVKEEAERVRKELDESKPFKTYQALTDLSDIALSKKQLVERYGKEVIATLPKGKTSVYDTDGTGWDLESAAGILGYENADQMVEDLQLVKGQRTEGYAKREAEKRVRDKYGDPMLDGTIVDRAVDAIHSEYRTERIQLERKLIQKARERSAPAVKLAEERAQKQAAYERRWFEAEKNLALEVERGISRERQQELKAQIKQMKDQAQQAKRDALASTRTRSLKDVREQATVFIADKPFNEIKPNIYLLAERKASRAASKALAKGEFTEAAAQKDKELLNNYLYVEAMKVKKEAEKKFANLERFNKKPARERISKSSRSGADYLGQIDNLLISWGLREPSAGEVLANKTLSEFYKEQETRGREPTIDLEILDITNPRTPESMDIEELRALHDAVTSISKLASKHNGMMNENIKLTRAEVVDKIRTRAEEVLDPRERPRDLDTLTATQKTADWFNALDAKNLPLRAIVELMDGGPTGPMHDFILNPLYEANDANVQMRGELAEKLDAALIKSFGKDAKRLEDKFVTSFDSKPVTRKFIISMALNLGTETGLNRVLLSEKLNEDQINEALNNLNTKDFEYIQNVWGILETLWPRMAAFHRSMGGVTPEKLPNRAFSVTTSEGKKISLEGGYYPLKTDTSRSGSAAIEEAKSLASLQGGGYIRFSTSQGAFKKRVRNAKPILYNFEYVLSRHLTEIVKDITHRAVQIDTSAILNAPVIRTTFDERLSPAYRDAALTSLDAVISDGLNDPSARLAIGFDRLANTLRGNMSAGMIAFKASTALVQLANFTNVVNRIGAGWYYRGVMDTYGSFNPFGQFVDTLNGVMAESSFMARRLEHMDRDIMDSFRDIKANKLGTIGESIRLFGLSMPGYTERLVSIAGWKGAKARGYAEGLRGAELTHYADDVVRASFGSGEIIDQTAVTRRQGVVRLMTMFATPIVAIYSENSQAFRKAVSDPAQIPALINTVLLTTLIPGVMIAMLKRHGPSECEVGDVKCYAKWAAATAASSLLDLHYGTRMTSDIVSSLIQGKTPRDPNFSPLVNVVNQAVRSNTKIASDMLDGREVNASNLFNAFAADATLLGLPGAQQLGMSGKFLAEAYAGNTSFSEDPLGILMTKPKAK